MNSTLSAGVKHLKSLVLSGCMALTLFAVPTSAAEIIANDSFEDNIRRALADKPRQQFLTITDENDLFGAGTDQNYTNGVRLGWLDTSLSPPKFTEAFASLIPFFSVNDTTSIFFSLGQNLYTPKNLLTPTPNPKDRPYAAFLYGSVGMATAKENHMDSVEFTLGVVGPMAMGKETQKFVHKITSSDDPEGWHSQLRNEPGLMISTERMWPEIVSWDVGGLHFRTSPYVGATVGNIYTYGNTGVIFQLVPSEFKWQSPPARVRPAMPGSGYFSVDSDAFSWSIFTGFEGRAMARNIFLDGNTFRDSPSVDKKILVADANAGVALTFGRAQMTYTINWRSTEFHGQDKPEIFGSVGLGFRF